MDMAAILIADYGGSGPLVAEAAPRLEPPLPTARLRGRGRAVQPAVRAAGDARRTTDKGSIAGGRAAPRPRWTSCNRNAGRQVLITSGSQLPEGTSISTSEARRLRAFTRRRDIRASVPTHSACARPAARWTRMEEAVALGRGADSTAAAAPRPNPFN